jgi:PAS domain S-box-containing protein
VEDEGFVALHVRELLENYGFQVPGIASYGEDAVDLAIRHSPDLIFMDIELMGALNGIEAARKIREKADIPIIYLTAYTDSRRLNGAMETFPYSYIVKPFNDREIITSAETALRRHKIEMELREKYEYIHAIVENAAEGILLIACETGMILETNPASTRLLGYRAAELSGMTFSNLITTPSDPAVSWQERLCSPEGWSGEIRLQNQDGSQRDVELTSRIIHRGGIPKFSCIVVHDITDRKRAEKALQEAHRKLNLLSGITRHDIINQLTILSGYLELTAKSVEGTPEQEFVIKGLESTGNIRRMISFTKEYEEIGQQMPRWQNPEAILQRVDKTLRHPGIVIDSQLGGLELFADPLLERVFHNLLDNTIRHGQHATKIAVTAIPSGKGLIIQWADDGVGVADDVKEKIFQRGFGRNTGLGLFLSREILGLSGIGIRETGTSGAGARFEITVPEGAFRYPEAG